MTQKVHIISLPECKDRRARVLDEFAPFDVEVTWVEAVDGRKMSTKELEEFRPQNKQDNWIGRDLTPGEIGCYLSHLKAWKTLLASDEKWLLVGEDDIYLVPEAKTFIESPNWIPTGVDVCQVSSYKQGSEACRIRKDVIVLGNGFELIQMIEPIAWGTQLYWINRSAAKRAVEISEKLLTPVDHLLFDQEKPFCCSLNVRSLNPFVVYQDFEAGDSLIEKEREDQREQSQDNVPKKTSYFNRLIKKIKRKKILRDTKQGCRDLISVK